MNIFRHSAAIVLVIIICACVGNFVGTNEINAQTELIRIPYKDASDTTLFLHHLPAKNKIGVSPALIFFFGGGWKNGTIQQFEPHAEYFSALGLDCFLADYRVYSRHQTTPFDAVKDAKSAIRYLHEHAADLRIDPQKIIAAGGSAGGHLAAAAATVSGLNDEQDNITVSAKPDALLLFNPVFDNGPGGYGYDRIGDRYFEISPMHNIHAGVPPTAVFFGTADPLVPVPTIEQYRQRTLEKGGECQAFLYQDQKHGFFNYRFLPYFEETVHQCHVFLFEHEYLSAPEFPQPIPVAHAHNDYRHTRPLIDAYLQGITSVEADILLHQDSLYIGHDKEELSSGHLSTLNELYLRPLFRLLDHDRGFRDACQKDPFLLWIDIKYDGENVYDILQQQLNKYASKLSHYQGNETQEGMVKVILSGDRPFTKSDATKRQFLFFDGRPENLMQPRTYGMPFISENVKEITGPLSAPFFTDRQFQKLSAFVDQAHHQGYKVRFWNTPDHVKCWQQLQQIGVDLINTDQLKELRSYLYSTKYPPSEN